MTPIPDGEATHATVARPSLWRLLTLPALAAAFAAGLALASPRPVAPVELTAQPAICGAPALELPPGHPPIPGLSRPGPPLHLPPGHPPIDGRATGVAHPAPIFPPSFDTPKSLEI